MNDDLNLIITLYVEEEKVCFKVGVRVKHGYNRINYKRFRDNEVREQYNSILKKAFPHKNDEDIESLVILDIEVVHHICLDEISISSKIKEQTEQLKNSVDKLDKTLELGVFIDFVTDNYDKAFRDIDMVEKAIKNIKNTVIKLKEA